MRISFQTTPPPLEDTDCFEALYPQSLQTKPAAKLRVLDEGFALWLLVNGELAGEVYGVSVVQSKERITDVLSNDFYLGKFTILPEYQNKGLGKILLAYFLASTRIPHKRISLHATSEGMNLICDLFGFKTGPRHPNWFDTGRSALFRYLDLP